MTSMENQGCSATASVRTRQLDIIPDAKLNTAITIIGVGAIGSFTALALAKMGIRSLAIWDNDIIDPHNIPNQFYRKKDIGVPKVQALKDIIGEYSDTIVLARNEIYVEQDIITPIVISAVDSIQVRKLIWNKVKATSTIQYYLDSRMGAEHGELYTVKPIIEGAWYEGFLWDPKDIVTLPCTARSIIYTAMGISNYICGNIKKILLDQAYYRKLSMDFKNDILFDMSKETGEKKDKAA